MPRLLVFGCLDLSFGIPDQMDAEVGHGRVRDPLFVFGLWVIAADNGTGRVDDLELTFGPAVIAEGVQDEATRGSDGEGEPFAGEPIGLSRQRLLRERGDAEHSGVCADEDAVGAGDG